MNKHTTILKKGLLAASITLRLLAPIKAKEDLEGLLNHQGLYRQHWQSEPHTPARQPEAYATSANEIRQKAIEQTVQRVYERLASQGRIEDIALLTTRTGTEPDVSEEAFEEGVRTYIRTHGRAAIRALDVFARTLGKDYTQDVAEKAYEGALEDALTDTHDLLEVKQKTGYAMPEEYVPEAIRKTRPYLDRHPSMDPSDAVDHLEALLERHLTMKETTMLYEELTHEQGDEHGLVAHDLAARTGYEVRESEAEHN